MTLDNLVTRLYDEEFSCLYMAYVHYFFKYFDGYEQKLRRIYLFLILSKSPNGTLFLVQLTSIALSSTSTSGKLQLYTMLAFVLMSLAVTTLYFKSVPGKQKTCCPVVLQRKPFAFELFFCLANAFDTSKVIINAWFSMKN